MAVVGAAAVAVTVTKAKQDPTGKPGKPEVALEFTPREVVAPSLVTMPTLIEFSGPLVAGADVVVHLAFIIFGDAEETQSVNLEGSRNVFAATAAAATMTAMGVRPVEWP